MRGTARYLAQDRGSIMLLGIGFLGMCLTALAVVTDSSSAFIQQRALQAQADSIALAGAQGIDIAAYYLNGATEATTLDPVAVDAVVESHVNAAGDPRATVSWTSTDTGVFVTVTAPLRLTFFDSLPFDPIEVSASARLDYRDLSPS
ncbi:MAG: hypothetical protein K9G69_06845 [Candidatus Nanopelagicales bacterium]|nr:hypothetical protein [Candidatus Nanopelagicales bacterium]